MKAQDLMNSILQYAMQGKLVPQDPNDEPASVLLERIKEEKERLIKEKVIKKEMPLPPITEEDIPFKLPSLWGWARIGDISTIKGGKRLPIGFQLTETPTQHIYIRVTDMQNNSIVDNDLRYITDEVFSKISEYIINKEDLYITIVGSTIGKVGKIPNKFHGANLTENAARIIPHFMNKDYLLYAFNSALIQNQLMDKTKQVGQPKLAITRLKSTLIPLPPLAEQKRIVTKIEELFEKVKKYDVLEHELSALNKSFPTDMEKSVLQYAMQGKLVEQDPNDKPASVLLEQIKEEKEQLIKDKVIKREKLSPITESEIPYEIPDTWSWLKLGEIITLISGRDLSTAEYNNRNEGIPYFTGASNFVDNKLLINRWTPAPKVISKQGDLLITCKGTIGETIIQEIEEAHIARQIMAVRPFSVVDIHFLKYLLLKTVSELKANAKSMIPGISRDDILNIKTPLPPLAEQKRIVVKIDEVLKLTNKLKNTLNQ